MHSLTHARKLTTVITAIVEVAPISVHVYIRTAFIHEEEEEEEEEDEEDTAQKKPLSTR